MNGESAKKRWEWWTNARLLRWILAAILIFGAGLLPGLANIYQICREELAQVGNEGVVRVCAPPSVADFPVVAGVLLIVVLLAPDLSEVSIGVLNLKQRVADQGEKQQSLEKELNRLEMTVQNTVVRQEQTAETIVQPVDLPGLIQALPGLLQRGDTPELSGIRPNLEGIDKVRAQLDGEFLHVMANLQFLAGTLRIGSTPLTSPTGGLVGSMRRLIGRWVGRAAFPELSALIEPKDDLKLRQVQTAFLDKFEEAMVSLESVRTLVASGVRFLDQETVEKSIDQAGRMLSYLTLEIENLPAKPQPSAKEEQPANLVLPDTKQEVDKQGLVESSDPLTTQQDEN